jgi:hypothetical protein
MNKYLFFSGKLQMLFLLLSITGFLVNSVTSVGLAIQNAYCSDFGAEKGLNPTLQAGVPTNSWHGIVPLRSTRVDVEKLLGNPASSRRSTFVYETYIERVKVVFSAGKCVLSGSERWNVASDVVITIEVRPKKPKLIQDLRLDPNRYPRFQESHPENWFLYRNKDDGVMIETVLFEGEEHIDSISYFPTTKDTGLRCPSTNKK